MIDSSAVQRIEGHALLSVAGHWPHHRYSLAVPAGTEPAVSTGAFPPLVPEATGPASRWWADGDRAVLFASRRRSSGVVKFPAERPELFDGDPEIQGDIEPIELSTEGTLYTYTTQEFAPPLPYKGNRDPKVFQPYLVGFVELAEGVLVETLIVDATAAELRIGQPLVSTTTTLETADGQSLLTFAFRPAEES